MMTRLLSLFSACALSGMSFGQNLPHEWILDEPNHQLKIGGVEETGLFNVEVIDTIYLEFPTNNWFDLLTQAYNAGSEVNATLTYEGQTFSQVGVSFKGQTSYMMTNGEEKKSFNIRLDANIPGQDLDGYDVLNLNNCFDDPSFLREFMYLYLIRDHIPAAKAAFVELVINDESWGIYPMVEQLDGHYTEEWFLSNDGTRWRADSPTGTGGGGGGGGPQWGDGTAALNYLGADETEYQQYYTLKSSTVADPWQNLIETCDILNNTPLAGLPDALPDVLDVDRTLWFLACENVFSDDDSYIHKGKMDYYCYWEVETGRMVPLEYDGNSILTTQTLSWSPFYHADNVNYPLLNRLLAVPEYRQRYLAHMRTLIEELVDPTLDNDLIAAFGDFIDPHVEADTKKLYSYNQFVTGLTSLHNNLQTRRNNLMNNVELNTIGAAIDAVELHSAAGTWETPEAGEVVTITAQVTSPDGLNSVWLYWSNELVGNFTRVTMEDNGLLGDGAAGDGVFGAQIPGFPEGTMVRFYIEARENNTAKTASYAPVGAEHDVYYYTILNAWAAETDIVINEIMADNVATAADEASEYEDWIELYNRGSAAVDISGYYLTDNSFNPTKWQVPDATILGPDEYLIIWADEDTLDGAFHTNFRLSASGETLTMLNTNNEILDQELFGEQQTDMGWARVPNGYGSFVSQAPTFAGNNDVIAVSEMIQEGSTFLYPNPADEILNIRTNGAIRSMAMFNATGQQVYMSAGHQRQLSVSEYTAGLYFLRIEKNNGETETLQFVIN